MGSAEASPRRQFTHLTVSWIGNTSLVIGKRALRRDKAGVPVGGASLAARTLETILHSILEHQFEDSRLPPENQLAGMLGVSRTTVRAALQSLEHEGLLTRSPRRGTQIHGPLSPSTIVLQRLIGFPRLLEEQGYTVDTVAKSQTTTKAPKEVYECLGMRPGSAVFEVHRLFVASGQPAIWAINYFEPDRFRTPPLDKDLVQSPLEIGELLAGGPVHHATVELVPRKATRQAVTQLGMKPAEPYLLLRETHFSQSDAVLAFSLVHVNDRFVRFRMFRGRY
ncbi:MAG: GntR family transcriptional regulator [Candidatus Dormibacterales bacterium]